MIWIYIGIAVKSPESHLARSHIARNQSHVARNFYHVAPYLESCRPKFHNAQKDPKI